MKSKDIALILIVAGFSAIVSFMLSSMLIASPENLRTQVKVVEKINPVFDGVDTRYFNQDSINPTQLIRVNENQNTSPFGTDDAAVQEQAGS